MVAFGMVGASISGVTFVSVPGMVLQSQMTYLQVCLGFIVGYAVVAFVLLPLYYRLNLTSIYAYLGQRLGERSYQTGAWFFLLSKMTGSAVKFYVVCMILQQFVFDPAGIPFVVNVVGMVLLIWLYTRRGGIATLVFTDTFQTLCLFIDPGLYAKYNLIPLVRMKETGKDFFLLLRVGNKQSFEFSLRKHNDLAELIIGEAENFLCFFIDSGRCRILKQGYVYSVLEYLTSVFFDQVLPAISQFPMESVFFPVALKDVLHKGFIRHFCGFAAHYLNPLTEAAAGFSKQSIADRIQDRGFTGPRFTADEEYPFVAEFLKVYKLLVHIGAEAFESYRDRFHPRSASSPILATTAL